MKRVIVLVLILIFFTSGSALFPQKEVLKHELYELIPQKKKILFQLVVYGNEVRTLLINVYEDRCIKSITGLDRNDITDNKLFEVKVKKKTTYEVEFENGNIETKYRFGEKKSKLDTASFKKLKKIFAKFGELKFNIDEVGRKDSSNFVKVVFKTENSFVRVLWVSMLEVYNNKRIYLYNVLRKEFLGDERIDHDKILLFLYSKIIDESPIKPESISGDYLYKNPLVEKYNSDLDDYLKSIDKKNE